MLKNKKTYVDVYKRQALGRTIICTNMDCALNIAKISNYSYRIVTLDGEVVNPGGALTGGSIKGKNANVLGRKREIEDLNKEISKKKDVYKRQDIRSAAKENNKRALLTMDLYGYQIKKQIGAYAAAMAGLDAIVFTAGIGEHAPEIRERALTNMEFLGIKIDLKKNDNQDVGEGMEISTEDSKVKVFVIPTNEELMIAKETLALTK